MRKHAAILAAATLAVSGWALAPRALGADDSNKPADQQSQQNAGQSSNANSSAARSDNAAAQSNTASSADQQAVKQQIVAITNAALQGQDLSQYLADSDKQRVGSALQNQQANSQIKQDWQQKYGSQQADAGQTFADSGNYITIIGMSSSDIANQARTAGAKEQANTGTQSNTGDQSKTGTQSKSDVTQGANSAAGNSNATTPESTSAGGRNDASAAAGSAAANANSAGNSAAGQACNCITAMIPAANDKPAVTARFVNEGGQWKLDIPDTVDGQKIQQNLQQAMTKLEDKKSSWPADANEAERDAAHCVLAALTDTQGAGGAGAAGSQAPGGTSNR
jgi:hypothetical protein